jgi:hypothetical protein
MNRQQRRQRDRERAALDRLDKKVIRRLEEKQQRIGECEVELYFTAMGLALNELYGFGQQRVARVWQRTDEIITELNRSDKWNSLEDMKQELKDKIDLECSFR